MITFVRYVQSRHHSKSCGFGPVPSLPLWLDAVLYAARRFATLCSPLFYLWCRRVDRLFVEQAGWPRSMMADTGRDCWIDHYWDGRTPQDAVDSEMDHWDE
jgi:hypothetical protein